MTERPETQSAAFTVGALLRGVILGALVSVAIIEMWAAADGVRVFRYQNF